VDLWEPYSEIKKLDASEIFGNELGEYQVSIALMEIRPTTIESTITDISKLKFVNNNETKTFLTAKRNEEHASGRYLLEKILKHWDVFLDLSQIEIKREENTRRPFLSWIEGTYQGKKLPNFSISHSNGIAIVALCSSNYSIGIDVEPLSQIRSEGLMEFMSGGNELMKIRDYWNNQINDRHSLLNHVWTIKESCMKTLGVGMGINPINLNIPEKVLANFPIEKSNFQLEYSGEIIDVFNNSLELKDQYSLSIAIRKKKTAELPQLNQAERDMLDSLNKSDANVGCSNN
tara:strand:+ start:899 stop:1765 length:867 start_codon:yes stop_codon:yes gene_type:complete